MSQYFIIPIYDPALLGHPYQTGESQVTEPFWQQYPHWYQSEHISEDYPIQPFNNYYQYNMDAQSLVIGSNTKNGRKLPDGVKTLPGLPNRRDAKPKAQGKVDVYINGVFIQPVPLSLLVRFSTAARKTFPRPGTQAGASNANEAKVGNWAEDESDYVDVGKLAAETAKLKLQTEPTNATASVSQNLEDHGSNKKLDVCLSSLWIQPSVEAFKFAINWMYEARRTSIDDSLLPYRVPDPSKISLQQLVDYYAAASCFGLRPPASQIRQDLFDRLTEIPPSIDDVRYIHEHLPIDDRVTTRMITSFVRKRDPWVGCYTKAQRDDIEAYFHEVDDALYYRFQDIVDHNEKQRGARKRERGAEALQRMAEGLEMGDNAATENVAVGGESAGHRRDRKKE